MQQTRAQSLGRGDQWTVNWQPTPVFLPRKFHRQRSLAGYSQWGSKELATTEQLSLSQASVNPDINTRELVDNNKTNLHYGATLPIGWQRVGHDWACTHTHTLMNKIWQNTTHSTSLIYCRQLINVDSFFSIRITLLDIVKESYLRWSQLKITIRILCRLGKWHFYHIYRYPCAPASMGHILH